MTVRELKEAFGLSEVSIRRDLDFLAGQGLLQRVRGGARASTRMTGSVFEARLLRHTTAKRAIAAEVAKLISPGETVLLDSGTTVLEVARALSTELRETGGLTVLTRSLAIAYELRGARNLRLIVLGGVYANDFDSFAGSQVERALEDIRVDRLVIGADGIDQGGLTTDNVREAPLFRQMSQAAELVIVAADASKAGSRHVQSILRFDEIDVFVTDDRFPAPLLSAIRSAGVDVVVAAIS